LTRPLLGAALCAALAAAPVSADQRDPRLDDLFVRLKAAPDAAAAAPVAAEIWRIWGETPDETNAALLARGVQAMNRGDPATAGAAFDLLLVRAPEFAEAWNKRATLRYLQDDDVGSASDIRRTLALEPRHFGALSGLALILERQDRPAAALESLKAALEINPFLPGGRERLDALTERAAGDPT
jgi:Tfp pilus assembly protein PilF